ncbi:SRPBCC family protein [Streptomyces salinarius]|uniref:SRPBCC family protein n=1 Tax=Streptomyces salinarius TaxID=2762598 RepID=A0ABW8BBH1_9ACTN
MRLGEVRRLASPVRELPGDDSEADLNGGDRQHLRRPHPLGAVRGVVTDTSASRSIAFRQATDDDALAIDIIYRIKPAPGGCTVTRTGRITISGRLRPVAPLVTALIRRENRRTMARLKAHLDGLTAGRLPDA